MTKLKDKQSVDKIVSEMTLEEKISALTGSSIVFGQPQEKYGIPPVYFLDGGTGANYLQMYMDCFLKNMDLPDKSADKIFGADSPLQEMPYLMSIQYDREATEKADEKSRKKLAVMAEKMKEYIPGNVLPGCFPPGILLGATWNRETVSEVGEALGNEALYYHIDVLLGTPNVNIHRDPLGGRLFEGYSEDPHLVSELAPEFVKGVQKTGVIANVKHFAANNQETDRRSVDEHIPIRALYEIYFPGFKACVQNGNCRTVMSSYNSINGKFSAMNPWLLTDVLKKEWKFDGFVVSDWGGAYDQVESFAAGNDFDMPGPRSIDCVVDAVRSGKLSEEKINESLKRVLGVILEMPSMTGKTCVSIDKERSRAAAYEAVKEGIVLLKNNGVLPLKKNTKVSFFGEKSKKMYESGGGSASVFTDRSTSIVECSRKHANVTFGELLPDTDTAVVTVGAFGQEGFDRGDMLIEHADRIVLAETIDRCKKAGKKIVVILNVCGPVELTEFVDDIDAIVCVFIPGMEGGRATADMLFGEFSPSGKLPITFPKTYRDAPSCGNFPGWNQEVWYSEGIMVGYRYYDYRNIEPMFPFGFGLSYTEFEFSDISIDKKVIEENESVEVTLKVRNTGSTEGKEVVQLYVSQKNPTLVKPKKELKHFEKVFLKPGEEKRVRFTVTDSDLASYDEAEHGWVTEPGEYEILVGNSSRNIILRECINRIGFNPYGVTEKTNLGQLVIIPGALEKFISFIPGCRLTRESIEASLLFASAVDLKNYWETVMVPYLSDYTEEEKKRKYAEMLKEMNCYH